MARWPDGPMARWPDGLTAAQMVQINCCPQGKFDRSMDESSQSLKYWAKFAGAVLVIVVLYWAQAVFVPLALAALLSFVLSPPTSWLERWVGRVPAVLIVVTLVFVVLGLAGWGLARQMNNLASDLPRYRANIQAKIADVRGAGKGQ